MNDVQIQSIEHRLKRYFAMVSGKARFYARDGKLLADVSADEPILGINIAEERDWNKKSLRELEEHCSWKTDFFNNYCLANTKLKKVDNESYKRQVELLRSELHQISELLGNIKLYQELLQDELRKWLEEDIEHQKVQEKNLSDDFALMSNKELRESELKWGEINAPDSERRLEKVREEINRRRSSYQYHTDRLKEAIRLQSEISMNAGYDEGLEDKSHTLFIFAHPRINTLLNKILGNDPKFPAGRDFKDVWRLDNEALDKLLKLPTQCFLSNSLEIILYGTTDVKDQKEALKKKLVELARFDSLLGEDLKRSRVELLKLANDELGSVDLEKKATRYFEEVTYKREEECNSAKREDVANRKLVEDYFSEILEPNLKRILEQSEERRKIEVGFQPAVEAEEENIFMKKGDKWAIRYLGGEIKYINELLGNYYIAHLMANPNKDFSIGEIILTQPIPDQSKIANAMMQRKDNLEGDAEKPLSELNPFEGINVTTNETIKDIKKRIERLNEKRITATELNNEESIAECDDELEKLEDYHRKSFDKKGRLRKLGALSEKKRKSVTRTIIWSLDHIKEVNNELYHHLKKSIKKGTILSYRPDTDLHWEITTT